MPQVGHTSGFTKAAGCPRWGLPGDARGEPHPPPCAGYRMHYIIVARSFRVAEAFEGVSIFHSLTADPRVAVRGVTVPPNQVLDGVIGA
jgi:hypothetical protein